MRRGVKLGIGIPLALLGTLLLIAGLVLLAFVGFDGTFTTPRTAADADAYAIVLGATILDEGLLEGSEESWVTLEVESAQKEVFVGVAAADDVASYLDGVSVAQAVSVSYPGGDLELRHVDGTNAPAPPERQAFWIAHRVGDGELTWELDAGDWTLVVMNVDRSRGIVVEGTATVRIPALGAGLAVILVIGVPLTVGGIALIVSALRQRPDAHPGRPLPGTGPGIEKPAAGPLPPRPDLPRA